MRLQELVTWFHSGRDPTMGRSQLVEFLHSSHPRTLFLKTLPLGASILDVGAGNGALQTIRGWPPPKRDDLRMYAYAMDAGEGFSSYEGFEIGTWPQQPPIFGGMKFDAMMACHFIEHIADPAEFAQWTANHLTDGGRAYIEWPNEPSRHLPHRAALIAEGIPIVISNFHDDSTHLRLPGRDEVTNALLQAGLSIDCWATIVNPFVEEETIGHFAQGWRDQFVLQSALWSHSRWAQYIIAAKVTL